jgi:hypothetical protein
MNTPRFWILIKTVNLNDHDLIFVDLFEKMFDLDNYIIFNLSFCHRTLTFLNVSENYYS